MVGEAGDTTPQGGDGESSPTSQGRDRRPRTERRRRDDRDVDATRAWTGLWVVVAGDVAIAVGAILGVLKVLSVGSGTGATIAVSILTSAFTAVGTMTTAYFGIRASSNTAERTIARGPDSRR
jgi:hypothetical protein